MKSGLVQLAQDLNLLFFNSPKKKFSKGTGQNQKEENKRKESTAGRTMSQTPPSVPYDN